MKIYKRYASAVDAAGKEPILKVGNGKQALYIVGTNASTDITLIKEGVTTAFIALRHLDRLGDGNGATPGNWALPYREFAFPFNHPDTKQDVT